MKKYSTSDKKKYSFANYKPNKNAKKVVYNGVEYLSKIQCMVLNDLDKKDLEEYLNSTIKTELVRKATNEKAPVNETPVVPTEPITIEAPEESPKVAVEVDINPLSFDTL